MALHADLSLPIEAADRIGLDVDIQVKQVDLAIEAILHGIPTYGITPGHAKSPYIPRMATLPRSQCSLQSQDDVPSYQNRLDGNSLSAGVLG